jgi:hypothetical protein
MAKITNNDVLPLRLNSGHVVPGRGGVLEVTNENLRGDNATQLSGLILSGAVAVEFDPEPTIEEAAIAQMSIMAEPQPVAAPAATGPVDVPVDAPAATKPDTAAKAKT